MAQQVRTAEPVLEEVADGVFAYVQPDGGWCVNNAGVLVSGKAVALVDTAATEARALRLRKHVLAETGRSPFVVVNTHSHGDHTFGNFVFEQATVFAHQETRREIDQAGLHLTELWPDVEWGNIQLSLPTVTYENGVTLYVGDLRAELIHIGLAHSTNDTVVWVPERKVLFTGDIVMSGVTPFCPLGSVAGSLRAIQQLRELGPTTVVTGHGPVGGPEIFDRTEQYLRWVQVLAKDGVAAGLAPAEVAREADLGQFAELLETERLVPNLHRAFAEERFATHGDSLDMARIIKEMGAIFGEMVEYNGGPLSCHA
ncbi:MBL fold metallo-hydrolase [Amycolatopsis palatopharyngis]|uniref:MBL fold metallo-hydrolase n=1 Tax=Amycolatopsis palatopharyngis TaxID=187982 RepID=UPI001B85DD82|nr:MBL fold metallo-hydrolase [Amycolatopsis palatopharyngis]